MKLNIKTTLVIPCYKVENHLEKVIASVPECISSIILVNDASPDNTGNIINQLANENSRIIAIHHSKNQGVGGAMLSGFHKAIEMGCDIVVKIDGDGQMDTRYIPEMITCLSESNYQYVKGNRFHNRSMLNQMPVLRRMGNLFMGFLLKSASGYWQISDPTNGYFAIQTKTLREIDFKHISKRFFFESSLLIALYYTGARIKDIGMPAIYLREKSNLSILKSILFFPPKIFIAYWRRIWLRYFIYDFNIGSIYIFFGFLLFLFGLIFGLIKWIHYASIQTPAPTGTIMLAVLSFILGFQMLLSAIQYDITSKNPFQSNYE